MIFNKCTELDKHHYSSILGHFHHPQRLPQAHLLSLSVLTLAQVTTNLSILFSLLYRVLSYGTLDIIFCFSRSFFDTLPQGARS